MSTRKLFDVVVVGGGAVGASAAAALAQSGFDVALVEPDAPTASAEDAPLDARVIALSPASVRFVERIGAWPLPARRAFAYRDMDVRSGDESLHFGRALVAARTRPKRLDAASLTAVQNAASSSASRPSTSAVGRVQTRLERPPSIGNRANGPPRRKR